MEYHQILVCSNASIMCPYDLPDEHFYEFMDMLRDAVEGYKTDDPRIMIVNISDYHEWNSDRFAMSVASGWSGGNEYAVCRTDAPQYVYDECDRIMAYLTEEIRSFMRWCKKTDANGK